MSLQSIQASAKRALKFRGPKGKRGDVIVLACTSQYTSANYAVTEHTHYCFAFASKVSRDGVVLEWRKHGMQNGHPVDGSCETVMLINDPDRQAAARELYTYKLDNFFTDPERIKSMILDRVEALR